MLDENVVATLVRRKVVSDTFRRLTPDKKEQIYRTTIRLFGEYGYDGLAVDRLCREAGISKGSFFQYFESKSHLLEFAILIFDDYVERWVVDLRRGETAVLARNRLLYLYQSLVLNAKLHHDEERFLLFVMHALDHAGVVVEGVDLERHFRGYVREVVERGVQTGEIRADVEVDLTTYLVGIIVEALLRRQFSGRRMPRRQTEEYLISFLFDGIKA
ncbi:MAG: TetR/AcrR family transcriptional regulator [candidate division Zixibacteria bacterium]|nr:TetR/AcrR family transcriptional regulator [candidate division Zixibacteria bacterium]